jgi:hypothetical protein
MEMRNGIGKWAFGVLLASTVLGGCRLKGVESFLAVTTPNGPIGEAAWGGDEYAAGGIAEASGGLHSKTQYGNGAKNNGTGSFDTGYDQPAKGSGQQPGEFTNEANSGFGKNNGPGLQAAPSDVNSISARAGQ